MNADGNFIETAEGYKYRSGEKGGLEGFGGALIHQEKSTYEKTVLDTVLSIAEELDATATQDSSSSSGICELCEISGIVSYQHQRFVRSD